MILAMMIKMYTFEDHVVFYKLQRNAQKYAESNYAKAVPKIGLNFYIILHS